MRQRLGNTDEMLELAERAGDRELAVRGHVYRMLALLDVGDVARADVELDTYSRLAEELRMPQHLWHVPLLRGMRASMDGRFADAERLADEASAGASARRSRCRPSCMRSRCRSCGDTRGGSRR